MQIHLLIPGLLWPAAAQPGAGRHPGLAWLLGRGQRRMRDFEPPTHQLARLFGLDPAAAPLPLAALRRLGERDLPPPAADAHWLCADPVNLSFAREHLLLNDFGDGELDAADAAALIETLNETFADLGHFEAASPRRWYLRLAAPARAGFFPLDEVVGRPIKHFLPEGEDARLWQRTLNEVQIVLHNHAANRARESAGLRPANSLWLWGAGTLDGPPRTPRPAVQTVDVLTRGFARAAGVEPAEPDLGPALHGDTLAVLDHVQAAAQRLDLDAWQNGLDALERDWFAPLAQALSSGRLGSLHLSASGDRGMLELVVRGSDRWKFWRQPQDFGALLKSLAPPPPPQPAPPDPSEYASR